MYVTWKNFEDTAYFQAIQRSVASLEKDGLEADEAEEKVN